MADRTIPTAGRTTPAPYEEPNFSPPMHHMMKHQMRRPPEERSLRTGNLRLPGKRWRTIPTAGRTTPAPSDEPNFFPQDYETSRRTKSAHGQPSPSRETMADESNSHYLAERTTPAPYDEPNFFPQTRLRDLHRRTKSAHGQPSPFRETMADRAIPTTSRRERPLHHMMNQIFSRRQDYETSRRTKAAHGQPSPPREKRSKTMYYFIFRCNNCYSRNTTNPTID